MTRLREQRGMTLVEVLMAWSVLLVGIIGTLQAFAGAQQGTAKAHQRASMLVVAQKELERVRSLSYAKVGLSAPPPASASEGPRTGPAASEALVDGGVLAPGPEPFSSEVVDGRIYRYVTWRPQACPLLTAKLGTSIDSAAGVTAGEFQAAVADLCPGTQHTKRVVVVVVPNEVRENKAPAPLRAETILSDDTRTVLDSTEALDVEAAVTPDPSVDVQTPQSQLYANATTQTLHLYDTPCSAGTRQAQAGSHPARDTGRSDASNCLGANTPDLLGPTAPPSEPTRDYSSDLVRSPIGGLALKRDTVGGSCTASSDYSGAEPERRWSLHRWSTRTIAGPAQTLETGARATLTLFTHTVGGAAGAGRLCVLLVTGSGDVLGSADFRLAQWPRTATQLAISFDVAPSTLPAGERVALILRNHPDSANDIELLYDRAEAASSLAITMKKGQELGL